MEQVAVIMVPFSFSSICDSSSSSSPVQIWAFSASSGPSIASSPVPPRHPLSAEWSTPRLLATSQTNSIISTRGRSTLTAKSRHPLLIAQPQTCSLSSLRILGSLLKYAAHQFSDAVPSRFFFSLSLTPPGRPRVPVLAVDTGVETNERISAQNTTEATEPAGLSRPRIWGSPANLALPAWPVHRIRASIGCFLAWHHPSTPVTLCDKPSRLDSPLLWSPDPSLPLLPACHSRLHIVILRPTHSSPCLFAQLTRPSFHRHNPRLSTLAYRFRLYLGGFFIPTSSRHRRGLRPRIASPTATAVHTTHSTSISPFHRLWRRAVACARPLHLSCG